MGRKVNRAPQERDALGRFVSSQSTALARRSSRIYEPDFEPVAIVRGAARPPAVHHIVHHIVHHKAPSPIVAGGGLGMFRESLPSTRFKVSTPVFSAEAETSSGPSLLALIAGIFLGGVAVHALTRDS
jgi:hypothetical protein